MALTSALSFRAGASRRNAAGQSVVLRLARALGRAGLRLVIGTLVAAAAGIVAAALAVGLGLLTDVEVKRLGPSGSSLQVLATVNLMNIAGLAIVVIAARVAIRHRRRSPESDVLGP